MEPVPLHEFRELVADAIDDLPDELAHVLDNVVIVVEDRNSDEPDLLGLYDGVPHTERTGHEGPDIVTIYRLALCDACDDLDDLDEEVYVTVIHEVAHAAGIEDERLHELGWA
ncbi:MAG: metallopeptidase family protein [Actinomycetota bacterium]|nr:metallopeptidase family protein [Actinomycetota bacterium]